MAQVLEEVKMAHELPPLPYAYTALEPTIDEKTMHLHHDMHHAAYVKNLNAALDKHPELHSKKVEDLVRDLNAIPEDIRSGMGRHIFGCDICQDVCPWNRKASATTAAEFQARPELVNPALDWLAEISPEEFRSTFKNSPVRRAKRAGLRRNAVIAMGNSGNKKFLSQLESLAADEDEVIAESAAWAIRKISSAD